MPALSGLFFVPRKLSALDAENNLRIMQIKFCAKRRFGESHRSLKTNRYTASAGKGFDASRVGDSHVDAPYRPR